MGVFQQKKKTKCLTHNLWNNLSNHISSFLNSVSIEDVSRNSYSFQQILNKKNNSMETVELLE